MQESFFSGIKSLSFRKSLLKGYLRRQVPIPLNIHLSKPVFVIGSSRSGTTILTDILSVSHNLHEFSENPIVRRHMWRMVENPDFIPTELPKLKKTLVRLSGMTRRKRILEKTPGHSLIAKNLINYFPDAKFIHILRNGRDVAFSMLKHQWISDELKQVHPVFWFDLLPITFKEEWISLGLWERAVLRWAVYVCAAMQISCCSDRYLEVRYEKLCLMPKEMISEILSFLDLDFDENINESLATIKSTRINAWGNKSISSSQKDFYNRVLSAFKITTMNHDFMN